MREIEFRGKRIADGEWAYGNLDVRKDGTAIITPDDTLIGTYGKVNPETVGQYTGFKDMIGKKMFEGDIVKIDTDKAIVKYSDEYSGFILKPVGEYYFDSPMLAENMDLGLEAIGNIYDNPGLLEA